MYIRKHESVREKETHKSVWEFEIQTNHSIPTRTPNRVLITKKKVVIRWILPVEQNIDWKE